MTVKINYIEIPVKNVTESKAFFHQAFDWTFTDYGDDYASIDNAGIDGGLYKSDQTVSTKTGSVLVVMYHHDLIAIRDKLVSLGATIIEPIFSFPGGKRFHFSDKNNNEYAIWTDK